MTSMLLAYEIWIRLAVFAGILGAMLGWEQIRAWRHYARRWDRRLSNLGIGAVGALLLRFALPLAAAGTAVWAQEQGIGLFNVLAVPGWITGILSFVILDWVIWAQHLAFHKIPWLWRLHRMHHSDTEVDVTTGLRFHPVEILLSMGLKMGAVLLLGAPLAAVVVFEIVLNGVTLFNHGNVTLPRRLDFALRWFVVTPHMHRVHHSPVRRETDSNYGFNLPWWDWLFRTYRRAPAAGEARMGIGLPYFREPRHRRLWTLLIQPLMKTKRQ